MPNGTSPKEFRNKVTRGKFTLIVLSEDRALTRGELLYAVAFLKRQMGWKKLPLTGTYTTRFPPPKDMLQTQ